MKSGFITDSDKVDLLAPKDLLAAGKEEAKNAYSRASNTLRRAVNGKSHLERTRLFMCELSGLDGISDPNYDQRGRMDLATPTTIRAAVLTLIAGGVDSAAVLPATNSKSLRMLVNALLSFHVLQPYGQSDVLRRV